MTDPWKWPALKGLKAYDDTDITQPSELFLEFFRSLRQDSSITMSGFGTHIVHETPQGGIQHWGEEKRYVCLYLEKRIHLPYEAIPGVRAGGSYLYLLTWFGPYMKGIVFHCGYQYPHIYKFKETQAETAARMAYLTWARKLYSLAGKALPPEIEKFPAAANTKIQRQLEQDVASD